MSPSLDFNFNLSTLIKIGIPLKKEITLNLICIFTLPSILFSTNLGVIFKYIFSQLNIFIIFPYMALINALIFLFYSSSKSFKSFKLDFFLSLFFFGGYSCILILINLNNNLIFNLITIFLFLNFISNKK